MQWTFLRYVFASLIVQDIIVTVLTAGPSWNTPSSTALSKTSSECGAITSLDASSTDGSSVVYSLVSQDPNGNFVVGDNISPPFGKQLRCTQTSITASSYSVVVRAAHDGGNNEHTDLTLTISFTDVVGGEAPVFVDPDPNSSSIDVLETIQAGNTILTLSATDADSGDTTLTFNMDASSSATKELFEITGNLLKVKAGVATDYFDVDEGAVTQFTINLEISDGTLSTNLSTTINVKDVNDNSPEFFGNCTAIIPESAMAGYSVLIVSVTDNDKTKENNQISLTLSGASEFEIIGEEILVATGADFDAIKKPYFRLTITASDDAPTDPKSTVKDITIIITSGQGLGGTSSGNSNRGWQGAVVVALCVSVSVLTSAAFSSSKGGKLL